MAIDTSVKEVALSLALAGCVTKDLTAEKIGEIASLTNGDVEILAEILKDGVSGSEFRYVNAKTSLYRTAATEQWPPSAAQQETKKPDELN